MSFVTLFGYGSIVSAQSASTTLQRPVKEEEMPVAVLRGFSRVWNYVETVHFEDDPSGTDSTAVFLNVERVTGSLCNGVLLQVTEDELRRFDQRERKYDRLDVTDFIDGVAPQGPVYVYSASGSATSVPGHAVIPQRYEDLVSKAAETRGPEFARDFLTQTRSSKLPRRIGTYSFVDPNQNAASGYTTAKEH